MEDTSLAWYRPKFVHWYPILSPSPAVIIPTESGVSLYQFCVWPNISLKKHQKNAKSKPWSWGCHFGNRVHQLYMWDLRFETWYHISPLKPLEFFCQKEFFFQITLCWSSFKSSVKFFMYHFHISFLSRYWMI